MLRDTFRCYPRLGLHLAVSVCLSTLYDIETFAAPQAATTPDVVHNVSERNSGQISPDSLLSLRLVSQQDQAVDPGAVEGSWDEGFESVGAGRFDQLETDLGKWSRLTGQVAIDNKHSKTGRQCLQLLGGPVTEVVLDLKKPLTTQHGLRFWAERWTSREPFTFRIAKETENGWVEIFKGDRSVRVGRSFLNSVRVPLGSGKITRLKMTCSSPPGTGILIDDLRIAPLQRQRIVSVESLPYTLPVLVGEQAGPLAKIMIRAVGDLDPVKLKKLSVKLHAASNQSPVVGLFLSATPGGVLPANASLWGASSNDLLQWSEADSVSENDDPLSGPDSQLRQGLETLDRVADPIQPTKVELGRVLELDADIELQEGETVIWVNGFLDPDTDLSHRLGVEVLNVECSKPIENLDLSHYSMQRVGVALREAGDEGVHTYRIPGLATTKRGTLIAVYDLRHRSGGDLPNDIDIGMSRSPDGGRTWQPMRAIMDMGRDPKWRYDGIGDPAVLVDSVTGSIWVAATWSHGNRSWNGSGPGMSPIQTGQVMLVRSDDDGVTWSEPINITQQVKRPEWCFVLPGPGRGITMRDGTIVFAAQYQDPPERNRLPHSTIMYSKDHGQSWEIGTGAWDDTTESQLVELRPGVLMLNCRYNRKDRRVVMVTSDLGKTWQRHVTSESSLIEPRACMASLLSSGFAVESLSHPWLLFSNPDSIHRRERMMIKASADLGNHWPQEHRLLLDEGSSAGYSCLTMIDDETVGILYEGSQSHLTFQRVPLADMIDRDKREVTLGTLKMVRPLSDSTD